MGGQRFDGKYFGVGQAGSDPGGLELGQILCWYMVVGAGGGFYAVDAFSHFGDVEVHFENSFFSPDELDHKRKVDFQSFTEPTAALPQKDVFGHLLADGAGAVK